VRYHHGMLCLVIAAPIALNAGAIEVVGVPDPTHLGVYPYVGVSTLVPTEHVAIIPSLAIEWSPEFSRWGFVASVAADYSLTPRLGLDVNVTLIHDQGGGAFGDAAFFLGAGPGISVFVGRTTISPYLSAFHGLNVSGWSIVPGVNVAVTL
jgi:hypothetical protein